MDLDVGGCFFQFSGAPSDIPVGSIYRIKHAPHGHIEHL